jgi:hypothetical protein
MVAVLVAVCPRTYPFIKVKALLLTCVAKLDRRIETCSGRSHNPPVAGFEPDEACGAYSTKVQQQYTRPPTVYDCR